MKNFFNTDNTQGYTDEQLKDMNERFSKVWERESEDPNACIKTASEKFLRTYDNKLFAETFLQKNKFSAEIQKLWERFHYDFGLDSNILQHIRNRLESNLDYVFLNRDCTKELAEEYFFSECDPTDFIDAEPDSAIFDDIRTLQWKILQYFVD